MGRVEKALKAVPGVTEATVNHATERATVRGVAAVADLIAAIEKVGYEANPVDTGAQADEEAAEKKDAERAELNPFICSGQSSMALLDELIATAAVVSRGC